jgi:hypothetical protein
MTLSAEQRQALEMLADAGEGGSTLDMLVAVTSGVNFT